VFSARAIQSTLVLDYVRSFAKIPRFVLAGERCVGGGTVPAAGLEPSSGATDAGPRRVHEDARVAPQFRTRGNDRRLTRVVVNVIRTCQ